MTNGRETAFKKRKIERKISYWDDSVREKGGTEGRCNHNKTKADRD